MSLRYKGGRISATPPTTTGGESGVASGAWTLEQQLQAQGAGNWPLPPQPKYIEDVFSTYLYTGNGSTQIITNGIDLAGSGGLVWIKDRTNTRNNALWDTARGFGTGASSTTNKTLISNTTDAQGWASTADWASSPSATGFTVNQGGVIAATRTANASGDNYASWTFRKQPKFFDVVTWTGDGTANRAIPHNLGSVPGMVFMKKTSGTGEWYAWSHAYSYAGGTAPSVNCMGTLNSTIAFNGGYSETQRFSPYPTTTEFYTGSVTTGTGVNNSGDTYVAYLFAHNAGGFGLTGTDNVISCGSLTSDGSGNASVTLGYEPQWIMYKCTSTISNWEIADTMRGWSYKNLNELFANLTNAEGNVTSNTFATPTATGFQFVNSALNTNATYIYIAIRRGPMRTPTDATKVFSPITSTSSIQTTGFPIDLQIQHDRTASFGVAPVVDRLRGVVTTNTTTYTTPYLTTVGTNSEGNDNYSQFWNNTGFTIPSLTSGTSFAYWNFRRAPGFFDEVCYTGDGFGVGIKHNLGVPPELIIQKARSANQGWNVYIPSSITGGGNTCQLNTTLAFFTSSNVTNVTSTQYDTGFASNGQTYVNYLFASALGVSKVGSYTGNGSSQTINCGFTAGARFVLIKRTNSTGDWYAWDTARGMVSGTDPSLSLNSTAAEVNANSIYTATTGFQIVSTAAGINASGGTYIYLAIA